jgi:hypothetical protein
MTDEGDCGAIGGMKIGRGNRSTLRKPDSALGSSYKLANFGLKFIRAKGPKLQ